MSFCSEGRQSGIGNREWKGLGISDPRLLIPAFRARANRLDDSRFPIFHSRGVTQ
jgi:hypothetical protein